MPIGAQPPGRRGTIGRPYSALNLRLVLASVGLVVCVAAGLGLLSAGFAVGWLCLALGATAVVDLVVIQRRRRARRRADGQHHSLFE